MTATGIEAFPCWLLMLDFSFSCVEHPKSSATVAIAVVRSLNLVMCFISVSVVSIYAQIRRVYNGLLSDILVLPTYGADAVLFRVIGVVCRQVFNG